MCTDPVANPHTKDTWHIELSPPPVGLNSEPLESTGSGLGVFGKHFQLPLYFFSFLPKKSNPKHSIFLFLFSFLTFYITLIIFYYYSNKKTHYKIKLFHFSIKQFQTFIYFILHKLLFTTIQTFYYKNSTITNVCQTHH
jgi:hypothetical protein